MEGGGASFFDSVSVCLVGDAQLIKYSPEFLGVGCQGIAGLSDPVPFAYDSFGAFVQNNVIFIAAFLLLLAHNDAFAPESDQPHPA